MSGLDSTSYTAHLANVWRRNGEIPPQQYAPAGLLSAHDEARRRSRHNERAEYWTPVVEERCADAGFIRAVTSAVTEHRIDLKAPVQAVRILWSVWRAWKRSKQMASQRKRPAWWPVKRLRYQLVTGVVGFLSLIVAKLAGIDVPVDVQDGMVYLAGYVALLSSGWFAKTQNKDLEE